MPKTKWSDVQSSIERRRNFGADSDHNQAPTSHGSRTNIFTFASYATIRALPEKLSSQSTLAIGIAHTISGSTLLVARKSVKEIVMDELTKARIALLPSASIIDVTGIASGLHAEMAIIRYASENLGITKSDLKYQLQICCIGKLVCLDCAGWMNKNGIGHLSVLPDKDLGGVVEFKPGGPSTMGGGLWENPITHGKYGGGSDPYTYQKSGTTINRPIGY